MRPLERSGGGCFWRGRRLHRAVVEVRGNTRRGVWEYLVAIPEIRARDSAPWSRELLHTRARRLVAIQVPSRKKTFFSGRAGRGRHVGSGQYVKGWRVRRSESGDLVMSPYLYRVRPNPI